jgi:hypothetical protein
MSDFCHVVDASDDEKLEKVSHLVLYKGQKYIACLFVQANKKRIGRAYIDFW